MPKPLELTGKAFSNWTVVSRAPNFGRHTRWSCLCVCGTARDVIGYSLTNGSSRGCGCQTHDVKAKVGDLLRRPEYQAWLHARARCRNPRDKRYKSYGGRGIRFSPLWDNFEIFLADVGDRPSHSHTLDRVDVNRGYEPGNCRWVTLQEQNRNTTRSHPVKRSDGCEYPTIVEAAEALGVTKEDLRYSVISGRQIHGFSFISMRGSR